MIKIEDLFQIGQFAKPHGVKGELSLLTDFDLKEILNDDPFVICNMDNIPVPFFIDSFRPKSKSVTLVKLSNIDSEETAKTFVGKAVFVPAENIPDEEIESDDWEQLTGYTVTDSKNNIEGKVNAVDDMTINILLHVDCEGEEILIPAALITSVDKEQHKIEVSLPDGFLEINKRKG